jgi:hypothetical protein
LYDLTANKGPDEFFIQISGSQFIGMSTYNRYLGDCTYRFDYRGGARKGVAFGGRFEFEVCHTLSNNPV